MIVDVDSDMIAWSHRPHRIHVDDGQIDALAVVGVHVEVERWRINPGDGSVDGAACRCEWRVI